MVSSTTLPVLTRSEGPADLATLSDPDLLAAGEPSENVWVAADAPVWNNVLMFSPEEGQTEFSRERFEELDEDDPRASPGPWAAYSDPAGNWQPLTWMNSSWRHVADPTVDFSYSITPWLVGSLVDIPFDGQVSIKRRDNPEPAEVRRFVGNRHLVAGEDPQRLEVNAGDKDEFVGLGPWVLDADRETQLAQDRERLGERAHAMLAGSGSEHENDYFKTSVWADLVLPVCEADTPPAEPGSPRDPGAADSRPGTPPSEERPPQVRRAR